MRADPSVALRLATLAGAILLTAGCGSRGTDGSSVATQTPSAAAGTPASDLHSPPDTPAQAAGDTTRCHSAGVGVEFHPAQGATGHSFRSVALRNTSGATCTVYGYVGMLMLDSAGHPLPTEVQRGGGMLGTPAPATVTLAPGATASFEVEYSDIPSGASPCPTSSRVEVTPPDATGHVVVDAQLAPCAAGRLIITALHAGPPRA